MVFRLWPDPDKRVGPNRPSGFHRPLVLRSLGAPHARLYGAHEAALRCEVGDHLHRWTNPGDVGDVSNRFDQLPAQLQPQGDIRFPVRDHSHASQRIAGSDRTPGSARCGAGFRVVWTCVGASSPCVITPGRSSCRGVAVPRGLPREHPATRSATRKLKLVTSPERLGRRP